MKRKTLFLDTVDFRVSTKRTQARRRWGSTVFRGFSRFPNTVARTARERITSTIFAPIPDSRRLRDTRLTNYDPRARTVRRRRRRRRPTFQSYFIPPPSTAVCRAACTVNGRVNTPRPRRLVPLRFPSRHASRFARALSLSRREERVCRGHGVPW